VAGAFALMRARYPAANHRQLIDQVLSTTDPLPTLAGKCVTGGRLNLARALGPAVIANFTSSPLAGAVPLTVKFTNTSFGAINSLLWDFGDGSTSGEQNPSHTYNAPGNFIASLKATGAGGATGMTSRSIVAVLNYQMTNATFAWIDPGATPPLNLTGDSVSSPLSLPFAFKFYGQSYSTLYVSANGLLGF
jgi:PKD repeat protein